MIILSIRYLVYANPRDWQYNFCDNLIILKCIFVVAEEDESALKRSELVNWYLKEIESEIDSEEELINKKRIIEKVIYRLTHYVRTELCLLGWVLMREGVRASYLRTFIRCSFILNHWGLVRIVSCERVNSNYRLISSSKTSRM